MRFGKLLDIPSRSVTQAATPQIVQELRRGMAIHETAAGQVLGLQPAHSNTESLPTLNGEHPESPGTQSSSASSGSDSGVNRENRAGSDSQDIPRSHPDGPDTPTWGQTIREGFSWFFRNVNVSFNVGGPGVGLGGSMRPAMGRRPAGMDYGQSANKKTYESSSLTIIQTRCLQ